MQSDDFWLREAHLNGIYDDAMIRFVAQGNRDMIRGMIDPDTHLLSRVFCCWSCFNAALFRPMYRRLLARRFFSALRCKFS